MQATIEDSDIPSLNARLEHFRDKSMRHVELPLGPTFSLIPRLHEGQRLLVVNDSVVRPSRLDAFHQGFHRELHILGQTGSAPPVPLQYVGGNAHARTAQHGGQADIRLRQMPNVVNHPKRNGECAGNPSVIRIFRIQEALDDLVAFQQAVVHLQQEPGMH